MPNPNDPSTWSASSMGTVPIGTGEAVTPLQILDAYNAVANGGVLITRHASWRRPSAPTGSSTSCRPEGTPRALARARSKSCCRCSKQVTEDGTAVAARIPGYTVAGKTGTAQIPSSNGSYEARRLERDLRRVRARTESRPHDHCDALHPDLYYGGLASAPGLLRHHALRLAPLRHRSHRRPGSVFGLLGSR